MTWYEVEYRSNGQKVIKKHKGIKPANIATFDEISKSKSRKHKSEYHWQKPATSSTGTITVQHTVPADSKLKHVSAHDSLPEYLHQVWEAMNKNEAQDNADRKAGDRTSIVSVNPSVRSYPRHDREAASRTSSMIEDERNADENVQ
jgi:hypothetical protein